MKNSFIVIITLSLFSFVQGQNVNDSTLVVSGTQVDSSQYLLLKNDQRIFGEVSYERPSLFAEPQLLFNKEKYNVNEVISFSNKNGFCTKLGMGNSTRNRFLKRTTMGRIDLYSEDITVYTQTGNMNFAHNEYVETYFSKDKINLVPIEYDNLVKNLNDNTKSMQHLQNYKTLKYVQIGIAGIGLGIVVAGLLKFDKTDGLTSSAKSTIFTGAIIMNLAWIPSFMKNGELSKAIDEYNGNVH